MPTAVPDFEAMTLEEIEVYKLECRKQVDAIRANMQAAEIVHARKSTFARAEQALKNAGIEGVVISPAPAVLGAKMGQLGEVK